MTHEHLQPTPAETPDTNPQEAPAIARREGPVANPRIQALMQAVQDAERKLKEALHDLENREQSPAFQKAQELLEGGIRLSKSLLYGHEPVYSCYSLDDQPVPDSNETEYPYRIMPKENNIVFLDPNKDLFNRFQLENRDDKEQVLHFLCDLTEEMGD